MAGIAEIDDGTAQGRGKIEGPIKAQIGVIPAGNDQGRKAEFFGWHDAEIEAAIMQGLGSADIGWRDQDRRPDHPGNRVICQARHEDAAQAMGHEDRAGIGRNRLDQIGQPLLG